MKRVFLCMAFVLVGCVNQNENYYQANGNKVSLESWACERNVYGIGLVFTEYTSEYNKVKINGVSSGLVVNNYIAGSPADIANLPLAVSIVRANGADIVTGKQFIDLLHSSPNSNIEIEYIGNHGSGKKIIKTANVNTYIKDCKYQYKYKNGEYLKNV